jgi:hypothetical protein
MVTVARLLSELKKYPKNALVYAYDGEESGIVIVSPRERKDSGRRELGFIQASEFNSAEADESLLPPAHPRKARSGKKNDRAN